MDNMQIYYQALAAARGGNLTEAERLCRSILEAFPSHNDAKILLGDVLLSTGRPSDALAAYDAAAAENPTLSLLFTRRATVEFRLRFGPPLRPRPPAGPTTQRIQMTALGLDGRFGNQLLQYAFLRFYASEYDLSLEAPDWIGRDIFDFDDPLPSVPLPHLNEQNADLFGSLAHRHSQTYRDCDISGYFVAHTSLWGARKAQFRALYTPGRKVEAVLTNALKVLDAAGKTIVAIHIRLSDFGYGPYWVAPSAWYTAWLRALWPTLQQPVLYVATDDPSVVSQFEEFAPWDWRRLALRIPGADFLIDHHILRHSDHLAISNSTFSFTAAMLNARARSTMRPHPDERCLVPFDPWSADPALRPSAAGGEIGDDEKAIVGRYFNQTQTVVHIGRFCSPWTNCARAIHPPMRILEADPATSIDAFRRDKKLGQVTHLVIEDAARLAEVLSGAGASLRDARIDVIDLRIAQGEDIHGDLFGLRDFGYAIFRVSEDSAEAVDDTRAPGPGHYMAVQRRIAPMLFNLEHQKSDRKPT